VVIADAVVIVNSVDVVPVVAALAPPGTVELEKDPPSAETAAVVETFA
jgi:hypothetical protein